ncbi:MAG: acetyltransferase [Chlorobi bacterium]|nr:acetyltransferase [Chlorobiota bacterium]
MVEALVLGTGGQSRVIISILKALGDYKIAGILDTTEHNKSEIIMGISVIDNVDRLCEYYKKGIKNLFIAIGNNKTREEYYSKAVELGFNLPNLISNNSIVDDSAELGNGNIICANSFIGPEVKIGNNNIINTGAIVEHEVVLENHIHIASSAIIAGRVFIGDYVFLGANSTVKECVRIAEKNTIGAGAVVVNDIADSEKTYVGVPVREVIK